NIKKPYKEEKANIAYLVSSIAYCVGVRFIEPE
ncbi:unnamed protein product, partial [marine sediment metagenome]